MFEWLQPWETVEELLYDTSEKELRVRSNELIKKNSISDLKQTYNM